MKDLVSVSLFLIKILGKKEKLYLLCVFLMVGVIAIIPSFSPVIIARITDTISGLSPSDGQYIPILMIVSYLSCIFVGRVANLLSSYMLSMLRLDSVKTMCEIYFQYLNSQKEEFFAKNNSGYLMQKLNQANNDLYSITRIIATSFISPIVQLFTTFFVLFYSGYLIISLLFIIYALAFIIVNQLSAKKTIELRSKFMDAGRNTYATLDDSINNFSVAKHYGTSDFLLQRYKSILIVDRKSQTPYWKLTLKTSLFNAAIYIVFISIALMWAAKSVVDGSITVGSFVMISSYTIMLTAPVENLGASFIELRQTAFTFQSFVEGMGVFGVLRESREDEDFELNLGSKDTLEFMNISYSYDNETYAIKNFTTSIKAGSNVVFTGPSGSGKTTLIKLIGGVLTPSEGSIIWKGKQISNSDFSESKLVGLISQDAFIFKDTLSFNLKVANPKASDEELVEALTLAGLADYFSGLPDGLNTILGNRGATLSGGQKQRISLARLFLCKPEIIIVDEGTSALDVITEEQIIDNIFNRFSEQTVIMISHKTSVMARADKIYVISAGLLVDSGTWNQLIDSNYLSEVVRLSNKSALPIGGQVANS